MSTDPDKPHAFTHLNQRGEAHVVDVGAKTATHRRAQASAVVHTTAAVAQALCDKTTPKGDVVAVARIAAIMAAKKTSDLIPLCHPITLTHVAADVNVNKSGSIAIVVTAECVGPTGVEMEAMTGASVGALAVYDMIKGLDRSARIESVELLSKSGGRSGTWSRK